MSFPGLNGRNILFSALILVIGACYNCMRDQKKSMSEPADINNKISIAERFSIEKRNNYTIVTIINPWQGAADIEFKYYLVRKGSELPEGLDSSNVIFVPVKKIVCMSTTYVAMIEALGEEETISGISGKNYIFSENIRKKIEKGLIEDVGYETNLNKEMILKISPDLVMMYGVGSESVGYVAKIRELGIKVIFNADYLETDPLAKAEWIKLFGALYIKDKMADSIYNSEVEAYNDLKAIIGRNGKSRPKVLLGLPFNDTWYISPGNSFISKIISDAGGDYLWKGTKSNVSMPFGIENVYLKAMSADYWLNIGSAGTKDEISYIDRRLKELPCFKNGNLYNNNKRITKDGGNDYWESGSIYPHIILKDISAILHPDLFGDYELFYYRKLN
jgi:iron complex transport system substrate-binding protein